MKRVYLNVLLLLALLVSGCSTIQYTVDDGRAVDEALLARLRILGEGERALRPAIARSAALDDAECSRQWELPFSVATSYEWKDDDKVAWVRALQVDERLTVIAAATDSPIKVGERIVELEGEQTTDSEAMVETLTRLRDGGERFSLRTAKGRTVEVKPFELCRGHTRLAPPNEPEQQGFHWLLNQHPLELASAGLSPDEALWTVLWGQGLSEEGGLRMKSFQYSRNVLGTVLSIASLASGISGATEAARVAADRATRAATSAAAQSAGEALAAKALEQATSSAAEAAGRGYALRVGREVGALVAQQSFMTRVGLSLSALSWVASTAFDEADQWAFMQMLKLGADPLAGARLHQKLVARGLVRNAFVLSPERLTQLALLAKDHQRADLLEAILRGGSLEMFALRLVELPSASAEWDGPESASEPADPFQISGTGADNSLGPLEMPLETAVEGQ